MQIIFYITFYVWTILFFLSFFYIRFCSLRFASKVSRFWTKTTMILVRVLLGITCKIHGKKNLITQPVIVVSNHQSAWETFFLFFLFNNSIYVLKKELKKIPIMNNFFEKLGFIYVDREMGSNSLRNILLKIKKKEISSKRTIIIFPEGTRVNESKISRVNSGFYLFYKYLKIPILPIIHNSGKYWHNKKLKKTSGEIQLHIFPCIKPGKNKKQVLKKINLIFKKTKKVE